MADFDNRYASNGKGNAALATGIIGTAGVGLGLLGALGNGAVNAFGRGNQPVVIMGRDGYPSGGCCSEDHYVNRYELELQQKIAEKDSQIALRDANTYGDQKMLEMYKYVDGQFKDIRSELCRQAVVNQKTEDSFALAKQDLDCCCRRLEDKICDERRERKCADNTIITYTNATFYPKMVAAVTTGTATTAQTLYNPLPQDNSCCCGNN